MTTSDKATLHLTLHSATTFGRGDGVVGYIDREVEHDLHGFPFLRGRTLKGLLREAAAEAVFALEPQPDWQPEPRAEKQGRWHKAQEGLFGAGSSNLYRQGRLHVGDARLPWRLRELVRAELQQKNLTPAEVLQSLTGIRRQTAVNVYGAPDHATLRSMRVILRAVSFEAELSFAAPLTDDEWMLLTAATLNLRAVGTGRNRGRGWVRALLNDEAETQRRFQQFQAALTSLSQPAAQPQE